MSRYVLTVDLKDDPAAIAAYREHHRSVWREVIDSLRRAGIVNMDIYLLERRGVMILETDGRDPRRCFAAHVASSPRVREWEALMKTLQQTPPGGNPGEWWAQMELVFSLDAEAAEQPDASVASGRAVRR
jgi:L-rhamnose mutarotase